MPNQGALGQKQVILITGTSRGIGRYLAEYYVRKNFEVIGVSRGENDFKAENYRHFSLDIVDEGKIKEMFFAIRKSYKQLHILVNNAAINTSNAPVLLTPLTAVTKAFETNFVGTFLVAREAAKLMSKNSFGRIVNFSSMAVQHDVPGGSIYTATKAAVVAFSRVFAKEIHKLGITCNVVAPAAIETDLSRALNQQVLLEVLQRNAIHGFGQFSDVTNVIDWLIQPESQGITGQTIFLGGV